MTNLLYLYKYEKDLFKAAVNLKAWLNERYENIEWVLSTSRMQWIDNLVIICLIILISFTNSSDHSV